MPLTSTSTNPRIAVVQHGDYREAMRLIRAGEPEPYFGMRLSVQAMERLFRDLPHCVVSLDAPSPYAEEHGAGLWLGIPEPHRLLRVLPETAAILLWRRRILDAMRAFRPSHVLLRNGNPWIASRILDYCRKLNVPVLVLLANIVDPWPGWRHAFEFRKYIRLLNGSNVLLVGNHKCVAAQSLITHGVDAAKVVAFDFCPPRHPRDFPVKQAPDASRPFQVVFAGAMTSPKGLGDLIAAILLLRAENPAVELTAFGDGPDLREFQSMAAGRDGIRLPGRASNEEVFAAMLHAGAVCVPSRHEFTEGMPMTLTEALASRTPVVVSDHPVLRAALREEEGVLFAESRNPCSFAAAIRRLAAGPALYRRLSETTMQAYERVECKTYFEDVLRQWAALTGIGAS